MTNFRSDMTEAELKAYWQGQDWLKGHGLPGYGAPATLVTSLFMEKIGVPRRDGTKVPNHHAPLLPYRIIGNGGTGEWCAFAEPGCCRADVMLAVLAQLCRVTTGHGARYSSDGEDEALHLVWPGSVIVQNATVAEDDYARAKVGNIDTVYQRYDYGDMFKPSTHLACLRHLANSFFLLIQDYEQI